MLRNRDFEATGLGPYILAWQDWLEFRRIAEKTRENYEQDLAIIAKAKQFAGKGPGDFTPSDVMAACNLFPEKARHIRTASVKSFFTWATLMDVIERNPFDKIPSVRHRGRRKDYDIFTEGEVDALVSLPIADGALMGIMLEAGLRKGECRNLQVRRISLGGRQLLRSGMATPLIGSPVNDPEPSGAPHSGELVVIGGKGDKDRTVQFGPRLHRLLQELLFLEPMEPNDYLWYCRPGGRGVRRSSPILEGSFDFWWKRCLKAAGVRYRKPHTTRHSYATKCLRRGMPLTILSKQLGHSSIATTFDEYGHLDTADVTRAVLQMEAP